MVGDGQCHVQYPASDPWVLSVGGTTHRQRQRLILRRIRLERSGPDPIGATWGTTGRRRQRLLSASLVSVRRGVPVSLNPPHSAGRGVPDVAGNASRQRLFGYCLGGLTAACPQRHRPLPGNGTSAAAPQWAGLIARHQCRARINVGFVNPVFYALGSSYFRDIVPGAEPADNSNTGSPGYPAGPGWDACTGMGQPQRPAPPGGIESVYARRSLLHRRQEHVRRRRGLRCHRSRRGLYSNAFWLVLEGFSITRAWRPSTDAVRAVLDAAGVTVFSWTRPVRPSKTRQTSIRRNAFASPTTLSSAQPP